MNDPLEPDKDSLVALAGGGVDSGLMMALALQAGRRRVFPLYVRQGALWEDAEEAALRRFLAELPARLAPPPAAGLLAPLHVMRLELPREYASQWALDPRSAPPAAASPDEAVYLPGRNLALLFQGALLAQSLGAHALQLGLLAGNPFPDSRPAFLRSFEQTFALATGGYRVRIETPLAARRKPDVLRQAAPLPLEHTFSCLRPSGPRPCGQCNKCAERRRGFHAAHLPDPTVYANAK